jgi:hypothetical protein
MAAADRAAPIILDSDMRLQAHAPAERARRTASVDAP